MRDIFCKEKFVQYRSYKQAQGFTLIEMSIALVIIGLLVGGVLAGRDLIQAAKKRELIAQMQEYSTAVNTFELKYNCLPGDCANATQFFGASTQPEQVTNGNGNKRIDGTKGLSCGGCADGLVNFLSIETVREGMRVFDHLAAAGIVSHAQYDETDADVIGVVGQGIPQTAFNSELLYASHPNHPHTVDISDSNGFAMSWISDQDLPYYGSANYLFTSVRPEAPQGHRRFNTNSALQPWDASDIDSKIDNGQPYSGKVLVYAQYIDTNRPHYCATDTYASDPEAGYRGPNNLSRSWGSGIQKTCGLAMQLLR